MLIHGSQAVPVQYAELGCRLSQSSKEGLGLPVCRSPQDLELGNILPHFRHTDSKVFRQPGEGL